MITPSLFRRLARISSLFLTAAFAVALGTSVLSAGSPSYRWSHFAGTLGGPGSADGVGSEARFAVPNSAAVDASGNVYVADSGNHTIRKITTGGVVSTIAGSAGLRGSVDGPGDVARFSNPRGVAVDPSGNVYVADHDNHTIRKITSGGVVTTLAGLAGSQGSADGTGSAGRFLNPSGVAVDSAGNVFVADRFNHTIRKITPDGVVTTFAGSAGSIGSADGTGNAARFSGPQGVAVDGSGNVFIADSFNCTIRKITSVGVVTTLAGTPGVFGDADGIGSAAGFVIPVGVAVDNAGNVFVASTLNSTIRKITSGGVVTTIAGTSGQRDSTDGTGSAARFYSPGGLAVDGSGNVFVADTFNSTIRRITSGGVVTTIAGMVPTAGSADGTQSTARFNSPQGVAADGTGNLYVADYNNHTIRKITSAGVVTTIAGSAGLSGSSDGTGSAARFGFPTGLAVDNAGNLYVADGFNTIRKITPEGVVTTFAGSAGLSGSSDGTGSAARFSGPKSVVVDGAGNVFVSDAGNRTIRKITPGGVVTTIAGSAGLSGSSDGTGNAARFGYPASLAVDVAGNLFVADSTNNNIRKITSAGVVTTIAGAAGLQGSSDGTGSGARFNSPTGIAVDGDGNIFVSDQYNNAIRKITSAGVVSTIGGTAASMGSSDGTGPAARFYSPYGIAADANGNLYVADTANNCIRKGQRVGTANAFNAAGTTDLLWQNTATGDRGLWRMAGTAFSSWTSLGNVPTAWRIAANADFNGDGSTDLVWENTTTGDRAFWFLTNGAYLDGGLFANVPTVWRIAGAADFNSDSYPDILWENTSTGDHVVWLLNGITYSDSAYVGNVSTEWRVAAVADFNGDNQPDLLWENTSTGNRGLWLMSGAAYSSWVDLGVISTDWRIAGSGDFNDDGSSDIIWENTTTGDRVAWLMNGTTYASTAYLGSVDTSWSIRN